jgi:hypothetical protein
MPVMKRPPETVAEMVFPELKATPAERELRGERGQEVSWPIDANAMAIVRPQGPSSRAMWEYITTKYPAFARALDKLEDIKYFVGPKEARKYHPEDPQKIPSMGWWDPVSRELQVGGGGQRLRTRALKTPGARPGAQNPFGEDLITTGHEGLHALWSKETPSGWYAYPDLTYVTKQSPEAQQGLVDRIVRSLKQDLSPGRVAPYLANDPHPLQHLLVERGAKKMMGRDPHLANYPW